MKGPALWGISALLLLAWGGLAARAQISTLQDTRAHLDQTRATLTQDQQLVQGIPAEQQRQATLAQQLADFKAALPDAEGLAGLLRDTRLEAAAHGLTLTAYDRAVSAAGLPGVSAVDVNVKYTGGGPGTQAYLDWLARSPRIVNLTTLTLTGQRAGISGQLGLRAYARDLPGAPTLPDDPPLPPGLTNPYATSGTSTGGVR